MIFKFYILLLITKIIHQNYISCSRLGLIIGAIIRYGFTPSSTILHMPVVPDNTSKYNQSVPPDTLWLRFPEDKGGGIIKNKTFAYSFRGEIYKEDNEIDLKVNDSFAQHLSHVIRNCGF